MSMISISMSNTDNVGANIEYTLLLVITEHSSAFLGIFGYSLSVPGVNLHPRDVYTALHPHTQ